MKLKKGEKGFTLIEMLVGMTIAVLVIGAASMTINTMMRLSPQNSEWAITLRQVQDAGYWISRDVMMSKTIDPGDKNPIFLTLTQPLIGSTTDRTVTYQFEDMSGSLKRLTRTATDNTTTTIMIAEYISSDNTTATYSLNCTDNCTLTFTITAVSGGTTVTRDYKTAQRVPAP